MRLTIELVAHRGDRARFPENTLPALRGAVEAGARFVEFDVQVSADEVPVLLHDATLNRTGNLDRSVFHCSASELSATSVGETERFGVRYGDTPVPTLEQAVALLNSVPQTTAFVELKRHSLEHFGIERVLDRVMPVMDAARFPWVLISFEADAIRAFQERIQHPAGWELRSYDHASHTMARTLSPHYLFVKAERIPADVERLWPGPWRWVVYGINDVESAKRYGALGASLVETDQLQLLLNHFVKDRNRG